ncbi:MAG: hypothetical protein RBT72_05580 [Spirochaetia bacterium]|jgi:hypothetical protein|nr:hypothetical protein [Spirochaetales bacterium]MDX9784208.1 hypothetical protein [Spirochaetia bacterium]
MDYEFKRFSLNAGPRLVLSAGLYAAGALLQFLLPWGIVPGLILILAGWIPLGLKPISNKPSDKGLEEWRPVSMVELDRLADTLRESKQLHASTALGTAGRVLFPIATAFLVFMLLFLQPFTAILVADAFLFLVPAVYFGRLKAFVPKLLALKMPCFQALLAQGSPKGLVLAPYLRFDKDASNLDVPEDIRLLLEPARNDDDFIGVQFQAAVNKGPSGEVPYMYAVFLTRGRGDSFSRLEGIRPRGYEVEAGGEGDYGSIVLRQKTSGNGYATKPSDCSTLWDLVLKILDTRLSLS